jgi:hypothetical protein
MENKITSNPFYPIVVVFFVITLLVFGLMSRFRDWNIDSYVVLSGNVILFLATYFSFRLYRKGLQTTSTHTFLRMTYSGMLLKMGICIVAVVGYGIVSSGKINKAAIIACIAFYFLYSFLEVRLLTRLSKEQKNA